jgi:hypothetical protein
LKLITKIERENLMDLSINNIIQVSVSLAPTGLSEYNPSNIALFSDESPSDPFDNGYKIYLSPTEVQKDFGSSSVTAQLATLVFSQDPNPLANGGYLVVFTMEPSETLGEAITRTSSVAEYNGIMSTWIEGAAETAAAATVVQSLNKIILFVQRDEAELTPTTGILSKLTEASLYKSRPLYYGSSTDIEALKFKAAYAGRGFSTVFSGSNTTQTMQLKSLAGITPDPTMTQTIFEKTKVAGADTYVSFQGVPSVSSVGANRFFDQVYNLGWFVGAIQVAGFNYLRMTSTKISQTQTGLDGLVDAYRSVCKQAVTNNYVAPGKWTLPDTFGNQAEFFQNIEQFGYYLYAAPVSTQSQADRNERKAPLVQIALKESGAFHSSSVIININA